jgi:hypothetical protein
VSLLLSSVGEVQAWSEAGHKIIASLAFRRLTPNARAKIAQTLQSHPRFDEDFAGQIPTSAASGDEDAKSEWLFQQASIWPDMARGLPEDQKALYNHPTWHYIDIPSYLTDDDRAMLEKSLSINTSLNVPETAEKEMNAVQTIRYARKRLREEIAERGEKAILLCWLMHDVGDLHQPLHSTAMFSTRLFPQGDKGGNSISTQQGFNLHGLWDEFLGDWTTFSQARDRAADLLGRKEMAEIGRGAIEVLDEKVWLNESRQLAQSAVYSPEVLAYLRVQAARMDNQPPPPLRLSEEYLSTGVGIATRRVTQAGYRLAAVLRQVVGE